MVWQGLDRKVEEEPFAAGHAQDRGALAPEPQDLDAIANACFRTYEQPSWPPKEDPSLTDAMKADHPDYGYVQQPNGMWKYALKVDESARPAVTDLIEYGGACLNDLTPDVYSLEHFKVTRVGSKLFG